MISFLHSHFPVAGLLKFVFVYLANTAVVCYSLTIICCCQVQNYIYWLISTENDHRHHHKFIKYEKRLRKEGNMLDLPINNNQAKSLPLQREIWRVALLWVRSIQRQRSNWSPTLGRSNVVADNVIIFCQSKKKTIFHLFHFIRKTPKIEYFVKKNISNKTWKLDLYWFGSYKY